MALQIVNIGTAPSDGSGDPLRVSFDKINQNFAEVYATTRTLNTGIFQTPPASANGKVGDKAGMAAIDENFIYYCTAGYNGISGIWKRSALALATW